MIRQTAEILTSSFRAEDVVGRLGGDEFCVFYTGQNDVDTLGCKAAQIPEQKTGLEQKRRFLFQACPV